MVGHIRTLPSAEIEDLFPPQFLAKVITRYLREPKDDFSDVVREDEPIVPPVHKYTEKHSLKLEHGWKVKIAMQTENRLLKGEDPLKSNSEIGKYLGYGLVGDHVQIIAQATVDNYIWYEVRLPRSGAQGWIRGDFVSQP